MLALSTLGQALILGGVAASAAGAVVGFVSGARSSMRGLSVTKGLALAFALCMIAANFVMIIALVKHDFGVSYVAETGTTTTPLHITIVSLWASLSGSILLWAGVLGFYVLLLLAMVGKKHKEYMPWTLGVLLVIGVFFAVMVSSVANPFAPTETEMLTQMVRRWGEGLPGMPGDGPGPNPLLQNHWLMVVHPPTLYLGYVGMAVPFSMCAAALFAGRLDAGWIVPMRRIFLIPWTFLTVGIILGGWWSYEVLGWGGYWAWDPVENASFIPWLTGTIFVHTALMMQRRASMRAWTIIMGMITFLGTLFGTFLTRSGVFNSVHAFSDGPIGPVLLAFIAAMVLFAIVLLALRVHTLYDGAKSVPTARNRIPKADMALSPPVRGALGVALWALLVAPTAVAVSWALYRALPVEFFGVMIPQWVCIAWTPLLLVFLGRRYLSRDFMILLQGAVLSLFTFVVFLGTIYPILAEALRGKRVSVGEPFFDAFAFPLGVMIIWLMGVGPMLPWGRQSISGAWLRIIGPASFASLGTLAFAASGIDKPYTIIAIFVCLMAFAANLGEYIWPLVQRLLRSKGDPGKAMQSVVKLTIFGHRRWGAHIAHYGVITLVLSMALAKGYSIEKDYTFTVGQTQEFAGYQLRLMETENLQQPHRTRTVARFQLLHNDSSIGVFEPAMHRYNMRPEPLTSPDVYSTMSHDVYLSVMQFHPDGRTVSLHVKRMPGVVWIWISAAIMMLGAAIAMVPTPRRAKARSAGTVEPKSEAA